MINTGLVSVTFREKSVEQIVTEAETVGLSAIEWGSDVHAPADKPEELHKIYLLCQTHNLSISSYGTYFRMLQNNTTSFYDIVAAAKILHTNTVRIWAGGKGFHSFSQDELHEFLEQLRQICVIAEKNQIRVCFECHNHTVTDCLEGALFILENNHSPALKLYWQPNQDKTFEDNLRYAKTVSEKVQNIHVFNWDKDRKYPLKDAIEPWVQYLRCFHHNHYALLEFMPDTLPGRLQTETDALKEIIHRI